MSRSALIESQIRSIETSIRVAQQQLVQAQREGNTVRARELEIYLAELNQSLLSARQQLQQALREEQQGSASAGQIVDDDAQARVNRANTQNPQPRGLVTNAAGRIQPEPDTNSGTNAEPVVSLNDVDTGIDGELRTLINTQSVPPGPTNQGRALLTDPSVDGREETQIDGRNITNVVVGGNNPGAGAGRDDTGSKNLTRQEIDNIFNEAKLVPQPNTLSQYASYTYVASLYLMSKDGYQAMMRTKRKQLNGAQLLIQSGGAPVQGRNPYFSNDYYIDKIVLNSAITGKGTNAAHNVNNVTLTVVEPNGITLISNLDRAVQDYLGSVENKKRTFTSQLYLLVIKFYGYDDNGNLVRGGRNTPAGVTDPNAFVEKWYPLCISDINFKVANKLVEYEIKATSPSYAINGGTNRGTIPYNVEVSGETVKDVLSGPAQYTLNGRSISAGEAASTVNQTLTGNAPVVIDDTYDPDLNQNSRDAAAPAPQKATAAPSKKATVRQGLMAAMNDFQRQLVAEGIYTYADRYSIEFVNPSIEQAKIKKPGTTDKNKTSMNGNQTADKQLGSKQSVDTNSRIETITAGTQIVQVLDKIIRNSFYMQDQQIVVFDSITGKEIYNGTPANNVAYFKISFEATPLEYDPKRNDYAYDIKYVISAYKINEAASNYFYVPKYNGVHKQYKYWFTGENSEVLSYEQNYNAFYTSVLSGGISSPATIANDAIKFNFQPRSGMNSQGAPGKVNEAVANLADYLFNPGDLANATMTIVGDPAWLQQGEAFAGLSKNDPNYFRAFLSDGTINFDSQQILFEIFINTPRDYDLNTGLIDPNTRSTYQGGLQNFAPGQAQQSYVYRANDCISEFNKGKFTQTIRGSLLTYIPDQTVKTNQQIAAGVQQNIIQSLSLGRTGQAGSFNIGSYTSPAFLANLPTVSGLLNQNTNFGINFAGSQAASVLNNVLGGTPARPSATATNPTSFGLNVGGVVNSINFGQAVPGLPDLATPPFAGTTTAATPTGTSQSVAPSDDWVGSATEVAVYGANQIFNNQPTVSISESPDTGGII